MVAYITKVLIPLKGALKRVPGGYREYCGSAALGFSLCIHKEGGNVNRCVRIICDFFVEWRMA